jgi:hypothetical protein
VFAIVMNVGSFHRTPRRNASDDFGACGLGFRRNKLPVAGFSRIFSHITSLSFPASARANRSRAREGNPGS